MDTQQELQVQQKREVESKQEATIPARVFVPAADIFETDEALTVILEMPGVDKDKVDVKVENDVLTIEGWIDFSRYEGLQPVYTEYNIGNYARSFQLSSKIDQDRISAEPDWRIGDLVQGERPATLYLVVPPSDISRTKPLVRLVLNQIGRRLTEDLLVRGHRVLLMLDEFPALGRLDFFESALAFMAGYGLKSFLIAQSLNQIEKAYGPNNAILDNCHVRVAFATNDERTARRISEPTQSLMHRMRRRWALVVPRRPFKQPLRSISAV